MDKQEILYGKSKVSESSYKRKPVYSWTSFQEDIGYFPDESPVNMQTRYVS